MIKVGSHSAAKKIFTLEGKNAKATLVDGTDADRPGEMFNSCFCLVNGVSCTSWLQQICLAVYDFQASEPQF